MIWLGVAILALTLAVKLAYDYKQHMAGEKIDHRKEGAIAFILIVVAAFSVGAKIAHTGLYLLCFLSIFWAVFDTGFGLLIARDPFFLGNSAWLDRLQKRYPVLQVAKYILAIGSIIILIKL